MDLQTIVFELKENGIGIATLNRREELNTISFQLEKDLHSLLDNLMDNLDCRVLILRAEGKAFCAGTDLKEAILLDSQDVPAEYKKIHYLDIEETLKRKLYHQIQVSRIVVKMRKISQPIIALINGAAAGAGFGLALAADIRIISTKAKFVNASINIGLTGADVGASYFLPRLIGMSRAAEILYSGRKVEAAEAHAIGLAASLTEEADLLATGIQTAENLLTKSPLGLRLTKEAINTSMDAPSLETVIQSENNAIVLCASSQDVREALSAFFEKRTPSYPRR